MEGMIKFTSIAETFYTATDSVSSLNFILKFPLQLLEAVRSALFQVASSSLDATDPSKLDELNEEFQNVQDLAGQILENFNQFQEKYVIYHLTFQSL